MPFKFLSVKSWRQQTILDNFKLRGAMSSTAMMFLFAVLAAHCCFNGVEGHRPDRILAQIVAGGTCNATLDTCATGSACNSYRICGLLAGGSCTTDSQCADGLYCPAPTSSSGSGGGSNGGGSSGSSGSGSNGNGSGSGSNGSGGSGQGGAAAAPVSGPHNTPITDGAPFAAPAPELSAPVAAAPARRRSLLQSQVCTARPAPPPPPPRKTTPGTSKFSNSSTVPSVTCSTTLTGYTSVAAFNTSEQKRFVSTLQDNFYKKYSQLCNVTIQSIKPGSIVTTETFAMTGADTSDATDVRNQLAADLATSTNDVFGNTFGPVEVSNITTGTSTNVAASGGVLAGLSVVVISAVALVLLPFLI